MLNQLVDAWHSGVTEFAIYILRGLFIPLLLYNMFWASRTATYFARNHMMEISLPSAMVLLFSVAALIRQILFFVDYPQGGVGPAALTSLCLMILGSILATIAHHYNLAAKFSTFYWLVKSEYFQVALRAADLARLDRDYAEGVLDNAETAVALRLAQKVLANE